MSILSLSFHYQSVATVLIDRVAISIETSEIEKLIYYFSSSLIEMLEYHLHKTNWLRELKDQLTHTQETNVNISVILSEKIY